ncbi:molybdopterin-dependent oxidoreductase [Sedimentibacter sp.]|uniref:molybdopterin-dependent oxidoreductase n=1 Tax=Sedimentibacter sp. TaxID=1960295 RepID=UPI0028B1D7C0|nr:molybdopterin-dependent oxidoreductase [Sedimentibacter sp.]
MKNKLLILLFIILLSLTSCTSNNNQIAANSGDETEVIKEEDEEIQDDEGREETVDEPENKEQHNEESKVDLEVEPKEETEKNNEEKNAAQNEINVKDNTEESNENEESAQAEDKEESNSEQEIALKIQGLIESEISFTLNELKEMNDLIFEADFYSLNSFGTTGYTHFKGVNLWKLLEVSEISPEASTITVIAQDGYKMMFTVEQAKKQDYIDETNSDARYPMIIAWEEKGIEYDPEEGAPFKLVVGQKEAGDVNKPNWVSNIDRILIE